MRLTARGVARILPPTSLDRANMKFPQNKDVAWLQTQGGDIPMDRKSRRISYGLIITSILLLGGIFAAPASAQAAPTPQYCSKQIPGDIAWKKLHAVLLVRHDRGADIRRDCVGLRAESDVHSGSADVPGARAPHHGAEHRAGPRCRDKRDRTAHLRPPAHLHRVDSVDGVCARRRTSAAAAPGRDLGFLGISVS